MKELLKTMREKTPVYSSDEPIDHSKYDCVICQDKKLILSKVNSGVTKQGIKQYDPDFPEGLSMPADQWTPDVVNPDNAWLWEDMSVQCSCVAMQKKQKDMDRIMATSNLSPRFKKRRFDTIEWLDPRDFPKRWIPDVEGLVADQRKAYDVVLAYCINFEQHQKKGEGFGLFGDYGTAKTHFLAAAVNFLLERKIQAVHVNTQDLLSEIRSTYELDENGSPLKEIRASEIIHLIKTCDFLSMDDVGTEKPTEWVKEKYYEILNHRYENELPTAFSTNNTMEELQLQLGKSCRRLIEPCVGRMVIIKGPSFDQLQAYRLKK